MKKFLSDKFRQNRGGWSRLLKISCKVCNNFLFYYQKDGPGPLKRSYIDRIIKNKSPLKWKNEFVFCPKCNSCLGFNEPYAKENNRPAIRFASEAITYKITPASELN